MMIQQLEEKSVSQTSLIVSLISTPKQQKREKERLWNDMVLLALHGPDQ